MGGGPRTFAGGLSKWQHKRMHEKLARGKERGLLRHEKQLYLARLRSEIRASHLPGAPASPADHAGPTSSRAHIRALADRFLRPGAEDLWNDDDGPLRRARLPPQQQNPARTLPSGARMVDWKRVESGERPKPPRGGGEWKDWEELDSGEPRAGRGAGNEQPRLPAAFSQRRGYGTVAPWWWQWSLGSGMPLQRKEASFGFFGLKRCYSAMPPLSPRQESSAALMPLGARQLSEAGGSRKGAPPALFYAQERLYSAAAPRRFGQKWRPDSSDEDEEVMPPAKRDLRLAKFVASRQDESEDDEPGETSAIRRKWSSAALRNCDMKRDRRPLKSYEEESDDITGRIQELREEIRNREVLGAERRRYESRGESVFTNKRFDECGISPLTVKALTDAGYIHTTVVQEAALPICLEGKDVLVKAKTGTGKSVAFLLPAIESVLNAMKSHTNHRVSPIFALVLCPTRELAVQVTAEANVLVKYHHGIGVQSLIGGTRFKLDQRRLESDPCQILVATPGRLLDHIENRSSFSVRLMGLKLLVLDEADHLLDLGFRKDIEKIADSLPRQRQTLLFSATIPKEVRRVSQMVLNKEHVFVDTVGLGAVETPTKVQQQYLVVPHELHFHMVHRLLREHIDQEVDYKVIVFCTTAMVTEFMYIMLRDLKLNVREIHSRKPQLYRTRISEEFRDSNRLILVTSDVSTRGVNYPDVTLVIQAGVPPGREHYIHRLGRTGREGKSGKGILLIAPWEEYFLKEIHDLPIEKAPVPQIDQEMKQKVDDSIKIVDMSIKEAAYHAWLGYYNSIADVSRDKVMLADLASRFGVSIGMEKPPTLYRKTALKMGLKGVPGIRIRK
ncbi:DEAD-box ATP-dependent RNA helicase 48-like [Hordeum vulgare]|nr:DEAD-box ATP-dependent RNA helicase 48-like [Hordeum vulgare]